MNIRLTRNKQMIMLIWWTEHKLEPKSSESEERNKHLTKQYRTILRVRTTTSIWQHYVWAVAVFFSV